MAFGVPGTRTGFALGHPSAPERLVRESSLGASIVLNGADKQSMRVRAVGASVTALATDLSQYGTPITVGTNEVHTTAGTSTHLDLTHPRTLGFRIEVTNTQTGTLYRRGVVNLQQVRFSAANTLLCVVNGATALTYTFTTLAAAAHELVLAWVSQANDDTTGAADAVVSWLYVWDKTAGTFDKTKFTHAVVVAESTSTRWGANDAAGTNAFAGALTGVWVEGRLASATEIAHDWVATLVAPATETEADDQGLPISSTIGFAAANAFHGPAAAWACDATRRLRYRLFSALWNECMKTTVALTNSALSSATDPWIRAAPDSNDWRMHLTYLRTYPVPAGATHLWVRVHVQVYNTVTNIPVVVGLRVYSFNKHPSDPAGPALVPCFVEEVITRDDTSSGEGSYVLKRRVPISKDADGWTYLAVVLSVDPYNQTLQDARTAVRVRAVHAVPIAIGQQGGLGFGGFED